MALRDRVLLLFSIKDTPHRISLAFALGVFIGISPLLGVHTILGILCAWLLGLNKLATITGVFVTNPWTIVPIYTFSTWVGARLLGIRKILPAIDWNHVTVSGLFTELRPLLMPFVVGSLLIGTVAAFLSYWIVKVILRRGRA